MTDKKEMTLREKLEKIINKCIRSLPIGLDLTRGDHDEEAGAARDKATNQILNLLREELPKLYIPAEYDKNKHCPTDREVALQKEDLRLYNIKLKGWGQGKAAGYDFNRGWEYGYGQGVSQYRQEMLRILGG